MYNPAMSKRGNIDKLYELAASQWGRRTSAQALGLHVSRNQLARMVADGRLEPMVYGVYRITAGSEAEHAMTRAAWLSLYPKRTAPERLESPAFDAVVTGHTAARMRGLGDFYADPYCFVVDRKKRSTRRDLALVHEPIDPQDVDTSLGIPVATPERSLADLVRLHEDPSLVDGFISQTALSGHIFNEKRLAVLLGPLCHESGFASGLEYAAELLSKSAVPAALSSSLAAFSRALDYSDALHNVVAISKMVNDAVSPDVMRAAENAHGLVRLSPEITAQMTELSKRLATITAHINGVHPTNVQLPAPKVKRQDTKLGDKNLNQGDPA